MTKAIIVINILFFNCLFCTGQKIVPAPADKAVVYVLKIKNFGAGGNYFDSTKLIGILPGSTNYIRYECEPGPHLIWVEASYKSILQNPKRDFIEAEIEAGKIYFIESVGSFVGSSINLKALDPKNEKDMNRVFKMQTEKEAKTLTAKKIEKYTKRLEVAITRGIEEYKKEKQKGKIFERLEKTMYYIDP